MVGSILYRLSNSISNTRRQNWRIISRLIQFHSKLHNFTVSFGQSTDVLKAHNVFWKRPSLLENSAQMAPWWNSKGQPGKGMKRGKMKTSDEYKSAGGQVRGCTLRLDASRGWPSAQTATRHRVHRQSGKFMVPKLWYCFQGYNWCLYLKASLNTPRLGAFS